MHIFHKWTKWTRLQDTGNQFIKLQFRECSICGKIEERSVQVYPGTLEKSCTAESVNLLLDAVLKK